MPSVSPSILNISHVPLERHGAITAQGPSEHDVETWDPPGRRTNSPSSARSSRSIHLSTTDPGFGKRSIYLGTTTLQRYTIKTRLRFFVVLVCSLATVLDCITHHLWFSRRAPPISSGYFVTDGRSAFAGKESPRVTTKKSIHVLGSYEIPDAKVGVPGTMVCGGHLLLHRVFS